MKARNLLIIFSSVTFISFNVLADNPYVFTSNETCQSSGPWTQRALSQTQSIIGIIQQLQSVPGCEQMGGIIQVLKDNNGNISLPATPAPNAGDAQADLAQSHVNDIESSFSDLVQGLGPTDKPAGSRILLKALVKNKLKTVGFGGPTGLVKSGIVSAVGSSVLNQGARMVEQMTSVLPKLDSCLLKKPELAGALLANTVQLMSTMSTSGEARTSRLAVTIDNFLQMVRDRDFAKTMNRIYKGQFIQSVSCLMESTTEAYCSTQDALHLLRDGVSADEISLADDLSSAHPIAKKNAPTSFTQPLDGYYVLLEHIPNVTRWLQHVQRGVEPRTPTDGTAIVQGIDNSENFRKAAINVRSQFIYNLSLLEDQPPEQKKNSLMDALQVAVQGMGAGNMVIDPTQANPSSMNFFTKAKNASYIPFFLVGGFDWIPHDFQFSSTGVPLTQQWYEWMRGTGKFENAPQFNNPDALKNTILTNLDILIDLASQMAGAYYQKQVIVNQGNLVAEAMSSTTYSVRQSLIFIKGYLDNLDKEFSNSKERAGLGGEEQYLIPQIRTVKLKVQQVLMAFEELKTLKDFVPKTEADNKKIEDVYRRVVDAAYTSFDVRRQYEGYLGTALQNFVLLDYKYRIHNEPNITDYQKDLLTATGRDILNLFSQVHGMNPAAVLADLNSASNLYYTHALPAIEFMFGNALHNDLLLKNAQLDCKVNPNVPLDKSESCKAGPSQLFAKNLDNLYRDTAPGGIFSEDHPVSDWLWDITGFGKVAKLIQQSWGNTDRYDFSQLVSKKIPTNRMGSDPGGGAIAVRNQLCILSLVFPNRDRFKDVCSGVVLESVLPIKRKTFELNASYDELFSGTAARKKVQRMTSADGRPETMDSFNRRLIAQYKEDNVCGYRNYMRRNQVYELLRDLNKQEKLEQFLQE